MTTSFPAEATAPDLPTTTPNEENTDFTSMVSVTSAYLGTSESINGTSNHLDCVEKVFGTLALTITCLGILGSIFSLMALSRKRLRKIASSKTIRFLAIFDMLYLAMSINTEPYFHQIIGFDVKTKSQFACQCVGFIMFGSLNSSVSMILIISAERYAAVCFYTKYKVWFSHKRTLCYTIGTSATVIAITLVNVMLLFRLEDGVCDYKPAFFPLQAIQVFIIPVPMMIVLNCCSGYGLYKQHTRIAAANGNAPLPQQVSSMSSMLFAVTITHILLQLPVIAIAITGALLGVNLQVTERLAFRVAVHVSTLLVKVNSSANFFLYVLFGRRFRQALKSTLACCAEQVAPESGANT